MFRAIGIFLGAVAFGICAVMMIGITAAVLRAIFGKPRTWNDAQDNWDELVGYDDNDPGVDVDERIESMALNCPSCGAHHLDTGEWYNRPHKTHLCAECGNKWRPFERFTRGV